MSQTKKIISLVVFGKGHFKSQALLDEQALITCMAYVDLNPIRGDMAKTPETSDLTSIQERIKTALNKQECNLMPFHDKTIIKNAAIPFELNEYIFS